MLALYVLQNIYAVIVGFITSIKLKKDVIFVPLYLAYIFFFYTLGKESILFDLLQNFSTINESSVCIFLKQDHNDYSLQGIVKERRVLFEHLRDKKPTILESFDKIIHLVEFEVGLHEREIDRILFSLAVS